MAAYYKVEVTLNSQAVQVGLPSPQSVRVTLPNRGPQGLQGIQGEVGPVGPVGETGSPGADGREVELQTTETHVQWRYEGESEWTDLVALSAITGPQGIQGETGLTGAAGADGREVELRKTETHVQWRYEDEAEWTDLVALSEITGPQGQTGNQGPAGPANTLAIGTVTTGAAGSSADATLTGDSPAQTLNLVIPRGDKGDQGDQGPAGTATTDASDLTTGTLADARLSSNVPLKDAANTFSANQTLDGTNNVAPNQTAASGSSLITRDLGDARFAAAPLYAATTSAISSANNDALTDRLTLSITENGDYLLFWGVRITGATPQWRINYTGTFDREVAASFSSPGDGTPTFRVTLLNRTFSSVYNGGGSVRFRVTGTGTLSIQFAQVTSSASATDLQAGAFLLATKLA